jgi:hypothetical protein
MKLQKGASLAKEKKEMIERVNRQLDGKRKRPKYA